MEAARTAAEADGVKVPTPNETAENETSGAAAALAMVAAAGEATTTTSAGRAPPASSGEAALLRAKGSYGGDPARTPSAVPLPASIGTIGGKAAQAPNSAVNSRSSSLHPTNTPSHASAPVPSSAPMRGGSTGSGGKKKGLPLRRGKWTPEEEAYANRLIQEFKAGLLPLTDGTTLRTFLSKLLNCDPMRISKKFVGSNCIGKQVFRRRTADINRLTPEQMQQSRSELSELERRFLERVAQTNRVKSSGVGSGSGGAGGASSSAAASAPNKSKFDDVVGRTDGTSTPSPPWLRPPIAHRPGSTNRAAAAGRALLQGGNAAATKKSSESGNILMAALQQTQSQQSLLHAAMAGNLAASRTSASNLLAAASGAAGLSGGALAELARTASGEIALFLRKYDGHGILISFPFPYLLRVT